MLQAIIGNVADVADRIVALNNQDVDRVSAVLAFFRSYTVFMQVRTHTYTGILIVSASVYACTYCSPCRWPLLLWGPLSYS